MCSNDFNAFGQYYLLFQARNYMYFKAFVNRGRAIHVIPCLKIHYNVNIHIMMTALK